jgi:hypothetical protein
MKKILTYLLAGALALLALAGCSTADPNPSEIGLRYNGGPFSGQEFLNCIAPGSRQVNGPNSQYFYYPFGTRTYNFAGGVNAPAPGADEGAILVNTKNNVQMVVTGSITFRLNDSCTPYTDSNGHFWPGGMLQKFHDTIGRSHAMFAGDSNADFAGNTTWGQGLNLFLGGPAGKALNNAGLAYNWQDLNSNLDVRNKFVAAAEADIKTLITQQAGDDFFLIQNVQVDQPQPPPNLIDQMTNLQAQQLQNQTAQQTQQLAANWPGGINGYQDYLQKQAVNDAIKGGHVPVLLIPQGSPIMANVGH